MSPLDQSGTCGELITHMGRQWPQKCAIETLDGQACTFAQLDERTNQLCNALLSQGLQPGDRAAILARNCPQYLEVFGLTKAGVVTVPLNWRLKTHDLLRLLEHSAPKVVFVDAYHREALAPLRALLPGVTHWVLIGGDAEGWVSYEGLLAQGGQQTVNVSVQPRDPACIVYTSGTTGHPKGVILTHAGVMGNCRTAAREMLELTEHDRTMAVMPLFHVGGMWYHMFPSLASGCTTLILSEFDPACVLRELAARRITNVHLVPTMIAALLQQPDVQAHDLSAVRLMFYAASSMPAELLRAAMKVFSKCGFAQAYGSTEGGVVTILDREAHERARLSSGEHLLASCGRPMNGRELRIVNDAGQRMALGAIGEIEVRSPDLMHGYWHDEAATRKVLRGGWLATGDLGYLDGEGFVYIADRKNDMIVSGGENVFPSEVEGHLYADADIAEAAVFGIPDPKWVERVVAAVVLKPGRMATEQEVMGRLKSRIAGYKCPKEIHLVDSLPKSAAGKVLRKELRIQYAQAKSQD